MKIVIDRNTCIGAASCVVLAAKTFGLDMEGKAEAIHVSDKTQTETTSSGQTTAENDAREFILEAAKSCPTRAISLFEDDGTPIVLT